MKDVVEIEVITIEYEGEWVVRTRTVVISRLFF
jgi:hypothetical protein